MIKSRRIRRTRHVARMWEKRNAYRILIWKPEGRRPLEKPKRRWVDNIKLDLREREWDGIDWIDLVQDRDHSSVTVVILTTGSGLSVHMHICCLDCHEAGLCCFLVIQSTIRLSRIRLFIC
jgi:hypothetical protein